MQTTGKIQELFKNTAILFVLLFLFGTQALSAQTTTAYVIYDSPKSLSFSVPVGGAEKSKSININDTTPHALPFTISTDQPWITVSTTSSKTQPGGVVLRFGVNPAGLAVGDYNGNVFLTASGVTNSPLAVPIKLTVTTGSTVPVAPAIMTQPASMTVSAGQTATFRVAATGTSPMTYQWKKGGVAIGGATASSYTTPAETTADNNAQFTVTVTNSAGSATSNAAILTVNAAANNYIIYSTPASLVFSAPASSVPAGTVQPAAAVAMTKTININDTTPNALPFAISADQPWITISTASSKTQPGGVNLQFGANPTGLAPGTYSGHVMLIASVVSNSPLSIPITLTVSSSTIVAPTITTQPSSKTVTAGQTGTFNVAATGTAPMTYQWTKNGAAISGATSSTYTTPTETTTDNNAQFTVMVTNSAGSATSNAAVLTVNASSVAPTISTQPTNQTVAVGQTASFSVAATGTAPMTYQWKKGGVAITGATSSTYTTPAETSTDNNAQFTVVVSNSAGNATSNAAILTVNTAAVAPTISSQPSSKTITAGQTASFSVVATGTAPLTYQWSKNGTVVSGATSSTYTTAAETTADNAAQFTVAVSNSIGNTNSSPAVLTVNAATLVLNASSTALNFGSVNVSSTSSQNITLTNAGNSNITISNVSVSGPGFNAGGVSNGLIMSPGQTATLDATFTPAATGSAIGSVTVASNASNSPDTIALSGTGTATVSHSVSLAWTPSISTVVGYNAYSSKVAGGPYTKLTSSPTPAMTYTDTTVQAGQTYYYVVTAVNSGNVESVHSNEMSALVP